MAKHRTQRDALIYGVTSGYVSVMELQRRVQRLRVVSQCNSNHTELNRGQCFLSNRSRPFLGALTLAKMSPNPIVYYKVALGVSQSVA